MDAQVQILLVQVRNTRTGKAVYDVSCSDGVKRQVWEPGLATALNSYAGTGQVVTIRYDVKQNGQYTNESIQAFAPPGGQLPPDTNPQPLGVSPAQPQQALGGNAAPIQTAPQGSSGRGGNYPPEVTTRITKLAAYDYAAVLVGSLFSGSGPEAIDEATELLDRVAKHVYAQARSHEHQATPQAVLTLPQATPQAVADFANAQQPGVVQVGAAVAQQQDAAAEAPDAGPSDVIDWD